MEVGGVGLFPRRILLTWEAALPSISRFTAGSKTASSDGSSAAFTTIPATVKRFAARSAPISIKSLTLWRANLRGASSRMAQRRKIFSDCPLELRKLEATSIQSVRKPD